jgi:hypothetical protein
MPFSQPMTVAVRLLPLKERTVEVAARDLEISRSDAEPSAAASAAL